MSAVLKPIDGMPALPDGSSDQTVTATTDAPMESEDDKASRLARRQQSLDAVGQAVEVFFSEAVVWRRDYETQWLADLDQFETGGQNIAPSKEPVSSSANETADYAKTGDNITRPAVLLITARISDMLFPTSDRNWDMESSPDPTIADTIEPSKEDGTPKSQDEIDLEVKNIAEERCAKMRKRCDDQLQESNYSGAGRDTIFDAALYGTGVIKGPFPKTRIVRKPDDQGNWRRQYEETPSAHVRNVDLFQFFPRPCRNIKECEGVFELELMTESGLRKLAKAPGFSPSQIRKALALGPSCDILAMSPLFMRSSSRGTSVLAAIENKFVIKVYSGAMPREAVVNFTASLLEEARIDSDTAAEIIMRIADDDLMSVNCETWVCNGSLIKLVLRPVDDDEPLYHVYNYEKRPDTVFGKGVPFVLRDDQLATRQLWQAMMLNAIMSSGPQIGVNKGKMEPMGPNGRTFDMSFTRPRVWEFTDETKDIREAMQAFLIPNTLDSVMPMYERAKQNANEHAMVPAIAQGDATAAVPTSSGLSMLMNAANIVSRQLVKNWDDDVTTPLLNAMYDWNLQSSDTPDDAKGDFAIIPRGVSHLLVKDVQAQRFLFALQIYSTNPELQGRAKWSEWAKIGLTVMELDAGALLKDEKEYQTELKASQENPPQDPKVLAEQNRTKQIENEAQNNAELNAIRAREVDARERMAQMAAASGERIAQLTYLARLAGLDKDERIAMEKMDKGLQSDSMFARIDAEKIAAGERKNQLEVQVESPNPRIM